jgi:hypothetical protein
MRSNISQDRPAGPIWRHLGRVAAVLAALALTVVPAGTAQAHHGWADFDTDRPFYIAGTVSQVRWGEPHSYFTLTLDTDLPADTPDLALPEDLQAPEDSGPVNDAPSYDGQQDVLDVVIAPPTFTGPWGLDRPLVDGERVEAVGYIGRSHTDEFRPAVFWFDNGRPVNQVLGSELPAQPLEPPYSATDRAATDTRADGPNSSPDATAADSGTSPTVVWARLAVMLLAAVGGSAAYLRARAGRRRTAS